MDRHPAPGMVLAFQTEKCKAKREETMFNSKKLAILVILLMVTPIVLAACGATPEPEVVVQPAVGRQVAVRHSVRERGDV